MMRIGQTKGLLRWMRKRFVCDLRLNWMRTGHLAYRPFHDSVQSLEALYIIVRYVSVDFTGVTAKKNINYILDRK